MHSISLVLLVTVILVDVCQCNLRRPCATFAECQTNIEDVLRMDYKPKRNYDFVRFGRSGPAKKASYDYIRFGKRNGLDMAQSTLDEQL